MRRPSLLAVLALGFAASTAAQSLQMGTSSSGISPDLDLGTVRTDVSLNYPATATGLVDTATFSWSQAPCASEVKIKFFRRHGSTLVFLAERGPFDATAAQNTVSLAPAVAVEQGDLIGITRLADCGNVTTQEGIVNPGYLAYAGDLTSDVPFAAGQNPGAVLNVIALGTATEFIQSVLPVAGSTPGNFGSFFRTGVQIVNPTVEATSGRLVFHPAGVAGTPADPSLPFTVGAHSTIAYDDVVETIGRSGLGTIDVVLPAAAGWPLVVARVFDDAGSEGTKGFVEENVPLAGDSRILSAGDMAVLSGPADPARFRYNLGIRSLLEGAALRFRVRDANGNLIHAVELSYDPTFFTQQPADTLVGGPLPPNALIEVDVTSGSAIVYGATVDNTTNDPSAQFPTVIFSLP